MGGASVCISCSEDIIIIIRFNSLGRFIFDPLASHVLAVVLNLGDLEITFGLHGHHEVFLTLSDSGFP